MNNNLYDSADKAHTFVNVLGPINAQLGNVSYVLCAIVGGVLALGNVGGFTLGGLASFLTFNRSFNMPINQVSQQMNSIVMALAGADRIFKLLDEASERDDGYVELVNAKENADGTVSETSFLPNAPSELSSTAIYLLEVDKKTGYIYIGTSDYVNTGTIYMFDKDGKLLRTFDSGGVNPSAMIFRD